MSVPRQRGVQLSHSAPVARAVRSLACGLVLVAYAGPAALPSVRDLAHALDHRLARARAGPPVQHAHPHAAEHAHRQHGAPEPAPAGLHVPDGESGTVHVHDAERAHVHAGIAGGLLALPEEGGREVGPEPTRTPGTIDLHVSAAVFSPLSLRSRRAPVAQAPPPAATSAPDLLPPTPPPRA